MSDIIFLRRQPFEPEENGFPILFEMGETQTASSGYMLLVQCWIVIFFSEAGSTLADLDSGGSAIAILEGGSMAEESINDARTRLNSSAEKTNAEIVQDQIDNDIDDIDQLLSSGTIIDLRRISDDEIEIVVQIISLSGISDVFVVPIVT